MSLTKLSLRPHYNHYNARMAPETTLTADTALEAYQKLKNFIGFNNYQYCPAEGWEGREKQRHLFTPRGFHHEVRWMGRLINGWRRLRYDEFCRWYGIDIY